MTEKNIFADKLFLSLIISDFRFYFYVKIALPLKKVIPLFPSNRPLNVDLSSSSPLFENLVGGSTPPPPPSRKGGCEGAHCALPILEMLIEHLGIIHLGRTHKFAYVCESGGKKC